MSMRMSMSMIRSMIRSMSMSIRINRPKAPTRSNAGGGPSRDDPWHTNPSVSATALTSEEQNHTRGRTAGQALDGRARIRARGD